MIGTPLGCKVRLGLTCGEAARDEIGVHDKERAHKEKEPYQSYQVYNKRRPHVLADRCHFSSGFSTDLYQYEQVL
jgi:hypothetical protein